MTIIVKTESCNLWWGIYGFCDKSGWEDLNLYYESGEKIGRFCLNTKSYLRAGLKDLEKHPEERDFVDAIIKYLNDDTYHYWFYYDNPNDKDFYEVPFSAPTNKEGIKPRYLDIWHPDENIDISTIESGVSNFINRFLGFTDYKIEIERMDIQEAIAEYKEHIKLFDDSEEVKIKFSNELIDELSILWNKPENEVLQRLNDSIK